MKSAFKTGDSVVILSGTEKGKKGKVLEINREKGLVLVEGVKLSSHFVKKSEKNPNGGINKREAFIPACKVMKAERFDARKQKKGLPKKA